MDFLVWAINFWNKSYLVVMYSFLTYHIEYHLFLFYLDLSSPGPKSLKAFTMVFLEACYILSVQLSLLEFFKGLVSLSIQSYADKVDDFCPSPSQKYSSFYNFYILHSSFILPWKTGMQIRSWVIISSSVMCCFYPYLFKHWTIVFSRCQIWLQKPLGFKT